MEDATGVLNVLGGASLTVSGLDLQGGDAGIVSRDDTRAQVRSVEIDDVAISQTGRGLLHLSKAKLTVKHVNITDVLWNALSAFGPVDGPLCGVTVWQSDFLSHGKVGIYVGIAWSLSTRRRSQGSWAAG